MAVRCFSFLYEILRAVRAITSLFEREKQPSSMRSVRRRAVKLLSEMNYRNNVGGNVDETFASCWWDDYLSLLIVRGEDLRGFSDEILRRGKRGINVCFFFSVLLPVGPNWRRRRIITHNLLCYTAHSSYCPHSPIAIWLLLSATISSGCVQKIPSWTQIGPDYNRIIRRVYRDGIRRANAFGGINMYYVPGRLLPEFFFKRLARLSRRSPSNPSPPPQKKITPLWIMSKTGFYILFTN